MDFDVRLVSKEINELLWNSKKTLSTAESCTAGRISSIITAQPFYQRKERKKHCTLIFFCPIL